MLLIVIFYLLYAYFRMKSVYLSTFAFNTQYFSFVFARTGYIYVLQVLTATRRQRIMKQDDPFCKNRLNGNKLAGINTAKNEQQRK